MEGTRCSFNKQGVLEDSRHLGEGLSLTARKAVNGL